MKDFVPVEKRSKKEQRALAAKQRGSWNGVKPYTRVMDGNRRSKLAKLSDKEAKEAMRNV